MALDRVLDMIQNMRIHKRNNTVSPHKFALLLAIADMYIRNKLHDNKLILNEELEEKFEEKYKTLDNNAKPKDINIEFPFYALSNDGFWTFDIKKEKEEDYQYIIKSRDSRFTKKRILEIINYAVISNDLKTILLDVKSATEIMSFIYKRYNELQEKISVFEYETTEIKSQESAYFCDFVNEENKNDKYDECNNALKDNKTSIIHFGNYLSTLISTSALNENVIAESQAVNDMFHTIHVEHPLTDRIIEALKNNEHVILTGHAGDGKTIIAVDVFKNLSGMDKSKPLVKPMRDIEEIENQNVRIIKDFSERNEQDDKTLIRELHSHNYSYLIVSNTGALLNFFRSHADVLDSTKVKVESDVLKAISNEKGESVLSIEKIRFKVYNLALMNNLYLAESIFKNMIRESNWSYCKFCEKNTYCHIFENVKLINNKSEQVINRLFLMYMRMYEYGTRLTIRQITSHLAYLISSGFRYEDIKRRVKSDKTRYLFFNRVFGDDGNKKDQKAIKMKAIEEINKQEYGDILSPSHEAPLWKKGAKSFSFKMPVNINDDYFIDLHREGSYIASKENISNTPENARKQARRILYFFNEDEEQNKLIISKFLKSANILNWESWQKTPRLDNKEVYSTMILDVIYEYFSGIKRPVKNMSQDDKVYITLSRNQSNIRQSAQVVLKEFNWRQSFELDLVEEKEATGYPKTKLLLSGKNSFEGIDLGLDLPFLDYVRKKRDGEIVDLSKTSYRERLNQFKNTILNKSNLNESEMLLIRMRNDNKVVRQKYKISDNRLEVSND